MFLKIFATDHESVSDIVHDLQAIGCIALVDQEGNAATAFTAHCPVHLSSHALA